MVTAQVTSFGASEALPDDHGVRDDTTQARVVACSIGLVCGVRSIAPRGAEE
jgi:hypothetical protein